MRLSDLRLAFHFRIEEDHRTVAAPLGNQERSVGSRKDLIDRACSSAETKPVIESRAIMLPLTLDRTGGKPIMAFALEAALDVAHERCSGLGPPLRQRHVRPRRP